MYYVYIMSNTTGTVLYVGVTNNLKRRVNEHKTKSIDGFTKKYNVVKLLYFDSTNDVMSAISQEKKIKGWTRAKKNTLISSFNPKWEDLYEKL